MDRTPPKTPDGILEHYAAGREAERLARGRGALERARTEEVIARSIAAPPASILDVGGGAGVYALPLAEKGYDVRLLDLSPLHVEQAKAASARAARPLAETRVGDARTLPWADACADAVLMLGPLYHLPERGDRLAALREARRVLRPGGVAVAATISRFASLFDCLRMGGVGDDAFADIVREDLVSGRHRNETGRFELFTTAYFQRPSELRAEMEEAGLRVEEIVGVEGPAAWMPDFEAAWSEPIRRARILDLARAVERDPEIVAASAHVLGVARK